MPYIQYCLMNTQRIDFDKISREEHRILDAWEEEGKIKYGLLYLVCSREFWDLMSEVLWLAYVEYENNKEVDEHDE